VDTNAAARGDLWCVAHDYMTLGQGTGAQMFLSLILSVRGKGFATSGWILCINIWLHSWCQ